MAKIKTFSMTATKLSMGLVPLVLVLLLITIPPVVGQSPPLKNDFTLVYGSSTNEDVCAMEFFSDDIVYIAGDNKLFLTKFNVSKIISGNLFPDWSFSRDRNDTVAYFGDMIIDSSENIYLVGTVKENDSPYDRDIFFMKFDSTGTLELNITWGTASDESTTGKLWTYHPAHPDGNCLVIDSTNNVYIAGMQDDDVVLIKFNALGEYQWNRTWSTLTISDPEGPSEDYCQDITIDSNDNIYIAIAAIDDHLDFHSTVLKYNSNGFLLWNTTCENIFLPGWSGLTEPPAKILVNSGGLFYYSTLYLTKFDLNTGNYMWNKTILSAYPIKMDYNSVGDPVILTGIPLEIDTSPGHGTCDLLSFTLDGVVQINETVPFQINPFDFSIDSNDNAFILSYTSYAANSVYITKIDSFGEISYTYSYGSPEFEFGADFPSRIHVDDSNNIYVSGKTTGFGGEGDFNVFFARFSPPIPSTESIPFDLFVFLTSAALITVCTIAVVVYIRKSK